MRSYIHELGVIDITGKPHRVHFQRGLNVVTGKSSTGKSALIEIFDYCFGSSDYTVPKGVITDSASIYYVFMHVGEQEIVLGRRAGDIGHAFFKREEKYDSILINRDYFVDSHFRPLAEFKKHVRGLFLDIDDVDESLEARQFNNRGAKSPTPSIRSFVSFMLQHQNMVANKHALFFRFDEKEKRDQAIEHTKIFLGLVDQRYFHLCQERESIAGEIRRIKREQEAVSKLSESQKVKVEPALLQLYAAMGFSENPVSLQEVLQHPQDAKERISKLIRPENIIPTSDAKTELYFALKKELSRKVAELNKLQRQRSSVKRSIDEEEIVLSDGRALPHDDIVNVATSVCPFCQSENDQLRESAEDLEKAITKLSKNLALVKPMRAQFESLLVTVQSQIDELQKDIEVVAKRVSDIEAAEKVLKEKQDLYEFVLIYKSKLDGLLDSLSPANFSEVEDRLKGAEARHTALEGEIAKYDYKDELARAHATINSIMRDIGKNFEFEDSYKPINLKFSFETFELHHLTSQGEKIFLRSMGSGANWLYCHVTLFLALHKYFVSLGAKCAIPSVLFFDQPTQVYFPSFKFDKSDKFDRDKISKIEGRGEDERQVDDDMRAVENLFSQLSIYCSDVEEEYGYSPQIIVTDHADDLNLSDGTIFEDLVKGNRWRTRGLIHPIPSA